MPMTAIEEIQDLRERGFFVRVAHLRPIEESQNGTLATRATRKSLEEDLGIALQFTECGGETHVVIYPDRDGDPLVEGVARCRSNERFNRRMGLEIATHRALLELSGEAERRRQARALSEIEVVRIDHGDVTQAQADLIRRRSESELAYAGGDA
jgi:hypothetical protein